MLTKPFAIGMLAVACGAAAGGGAYVAVRQNHASAAHAAPADEPAAASPAVPETEASVSPAVAEPLAVETSRRLRQPEVSAESKADVGARPRAAAEQPSEKHEPAAPRPARTAATSSAAPPAPAAQPVAPRTDPPAAPAAIEPPRDEPPPAPPAPVFDELVVPSASVMGLQIQTAVSSERARVEDRVDARVTRDLNVDGKTAVPAGTRVVGSVTLVERGGKVKERARLGVRFHTLVLADGSELPIRTETVIREGESPAGDSTRKIGGAAAGGAILGAIIGGKKGALIGGATGAAGGTAAVMAGGRDAATLPVGAVLTVRLSAPLPVSVERQ